MKACVFRLCSEAKQCLVLLTHLLRLNGIYIYENTRPDKNERLGQVWAIIIFGMHEDKQLTSPALEVLCVITLA